jgi:hypothetical protein
MPTRKWSPGERLAEARSRKPAVSCGVQVPDRAAEEDEEQGREVAEEGKGALVRRRDAADREARVLGAERRARLGEHPEAHVDGHVASARPRAQQVARLHGAAGAQLDERRRPRDVADLRRVLGEERRLRARLVVLGLLADALEDVAPRVVVEPPTVEPARAVGEPAHDRLRERIGRLLEGVDLELEAPVALAAEAGEWVRPRHSLGCYAACGAGSTPGIRGRILVTGPVRNRT